MKSFYATLALAAFLASPSAYAATGSASAVISASAPEFVTVSVTAGVAIPPLNVNGVLGGGTVVVTGGTVGVVNNTSFSGDVQITLQGQTSNVFGVLDGPAAAAGFENTIGINSVILSVNGTPSSFTPVNTNTGATVADLIPAHSIISAANTSLSLVTVPGTNPLVAGPYSGTITVSVNAS